MLPRRLLEQLIAIPSVNPMGRDLSGPEFLETRMTEFLATFFRELDVPFQVIEVHPGRANVIARYDAGDDRPCVLLDAHQDTVPTDGMTIDPFQPTVEGGRMYGRGSCDVKGGMAAMLSAFARLVKERPPRAANVVMSCTCDEEATVTGVYDLVRLWSDPGRAGSLLEKRPEMAIVAEPTDLDIVVAHRGATRWKIATTGRACHSSRPSDGINAIYRMARVVTCMEEYAALLPSLVAEHPLCGPATLSVGRIEGGVSVNTVPDFCTIEIDRRVVPGEDGHAVREHVMNWLAERVDSPVEHLPPWIVGEALSDDENGDLAERLLGCVTEVAGPKRRVGVPYGTHASRISLGGVPSVVFGPGSIAQAHTKDEWIDLTELDQAAEVYFNFCANAAH